MYFRDLDPGESPFSEALTRGLIIHRMLELMRATGQTPTEVFLTVREEYPRYEAQLLLTVALIYMQRYVKVYADDPLKYNFVAVEQRFIIPYTTPRGHQVYLDGRFDAIVENLSEGGRLEIWDDKTDSRNVWSSDVVALDRQLNGYAVMASLLDYDPTRIVVNQIKTSYKSPESVAKQPKENLFARHSAPVTPKTVAAWTLAIGKRIDQILEAEYVHKNLGAHCMYCPFRQACQMELNGLNPEPYLRSFGKRSEATPGGGNLNLILDIEDGVFDD